MRSATRYLLILPVALGAFLMLYDLGERDVWADEYFTYAVVFEGGFPSRVMTDIHPPLYYLLAIGATRFADDGLWALRLLSAACGIISIFISFILCRRYFGRLAGDIFLILMPLNCHLVLFSRMGRYYAPLMLFVLLSQLAFDRLAERRGWGNTIIYTVSLVICFYMNLVSVLLIPAHLTMAALRRKPLGYILAGQGYALALLMAWVPVAYGQLAGKGTLAPFSNDVPLTLMGFAMRLLWPIYDLSLGENIPPWDAALAIPALIVIALSFIWFAIRGTRRLEFIAYLIWILAPLAVLTASILPVGIEFLPPRAMFLLPFWLMIIAAGISRMPRNVAPIPVIVLIFVSLIGNYRYYRDMSTFHSTYIIPWADMADEADLLAGDDGIIVTDDESMAFYLGDDERLKFLSILSDPRELTRTRRPIVLVVNPRDVTPGARLAPFLDALQKEGYRESDVREFLVEDEKTLRIKERLLKREVSRAKREVRLYVPRWGAKE
jgi:hypothetical protein